MPRRRVRAEEALPVRVGKDEMNFVENPIAVLTDRPDRETKTLKFTRHIEDGGHLVESNWIITGSDEFGLPIAGDEDIYLVLLELAKEAGFASRTIPFSRYELLRRLKGDASRIYGSDYERLQGALNRLVGVTIYADRWFDRATGKYATYSFHILEKVVVQDEAPGRKRAGQIPLRLSFATWDETVFRNFQHGYLKNLDLERYFSLSSPIAKRLYRFLDKRFYDGKPQYQMNLRELACGHIGLTGNYRYDSKIKEKMRPAHDELVEKGCIAGVEFKKGKEGIVVVYYPNPKGRRAALPEGGPGEAAPPSETGGFVLLSAEEELVTCGVTREVAQRLVREHGEERVREKIAYLPYGKADKNRAGWLRRAIEEDWAAPQGYLDAVAREVKRRERRAAAAEKRKAAEGQGDHLERALALLTEEERKTLDARAEASVRERHPQAAQLADRGKGLGAWKRLLAEETERLVLGGD